MAAIFARSQTSFPAEDLGEMAGIRITDIESDLYHTLLRFTQQLSLYFIISLAVFIERLIEPPIDRLLQRVYKNAHRKPSLFPVYDPLTNLRSIFTLNSHEGEKWLT